MVCLELSLSDTLKLYLFLKLVVKILWVMDVVRVRPQEGF